MTADELRELADALEPMACAPRFDGLGVPALTDYLRACASAMDAGPVAWRFRFPTSRRWHYTEHGPHAQSRQGLAWEPLYPLAMPAPLRMPEPMTDAEADALIDETEYLPTDRAVRYLVSEGERRVREVNDAAAAPNPPAQQDELCPTCGDYLHPNFACAEAAALRDPSEDWGDDPLTRLIRTSEELGAYRQPSQDEKFTPDGLPIIQPIKRDWPTQTPAPDGAVAVCGVCGIRIMRVMGYVCSRGDCPTGLGPVMCVGAA